MLGLARLAQAHRGGTPPPSGYKATVLADTPLLFYMLDETSGTTASNAGSFAGANGVYSGGYTLSQTTSRTGISKGVVFDGTTGKVATASIAPLTGAAAVSYEVWLFPYDTATTARISAFSSSYISLGGTQIYFDNQGALQLIYSPFNSNPASAYHIVYTQDASGEKLYINNALAKTTTNAHAANSSSAPYYLGTDNTHFAHCLLAGYAVYGQALTPTQVSNHYNAGK